MVTTLSMAMASTLTQLIAVRVATGMFGGPVVASSLAVIADVFPEQRRGEAMGKVLGSFSIASVIGVPLGLEIARLFGWWAPFVVVSAVAAMTVTTIRLYLPPMRHHLDHINAAKPPSLFISLYHNAAMLPALIMTAAAMFAAFLIIPNISAHVQQNMGYPRARLGLLYFCGGVAAFFSMRITGKQSDRIGYAKTALYALFGLWITLYIGFYAQIRAVPVLAVFVAFMITMSTRNVTSNALISEIPKSEERAGFMSLVSAVQHLMAGAGAMCSTLLLKGTVDSRLAGMDKVTLMAMAGFGLSVWLMFKIEKVVEKRAPMPPIKADLL